MRFEALGAVGLVRDDGERVELPSRKRRLVLALLLLHANEWVRTDRIADVLWGGVPPRSSAANVKTYVSNLRRLAAGGAARIVNGANGYRLGVTRNEFDVLLFEDGVAQGRAAWNEGRMRDAVDVLRGALDLWRGEPFAELTGAEAEAARSRLGDHRLAAHEHLAQALMSLRRHDEAVAVLRRVVAENPFMEHPRGLLMTALHQTGRSAEALEIYDDARRVLDRELGLRPGAELRRLQSAILTHDPGLDLTRTPSRPGVAQLPAAPDVFAGRERELDVLTAAVESSARAGGTVVISAIRGAGGMGKTWLALRWAYRNLDRFPDGQLFVDLRGFSPDGPPMDPAVAVRGFLDALGVEAGRVPVEPHAQAALFRSLVAHKRLLVVLDNAADTAQVVPLLPGGDACTVLVTSRDRMPGLITGHGAQHLALDPLSHAEARALLTGRLGAERVAAEEAAIEDLVRLCGGYPLALSIIAARARLEPGTPLAAIAAEVRDSGLDALDEGDPAASLPAVLSWSYRALTAEQATVFGLLGQAPGPDIGPGAAVALTGLSRTRTEQVLDALEDASLISREAGGRYRMHDLIRRYAADTARGSREAAEAHRRVVDHYLHTTYATVALLDPHRPAVPLAPAAPGAAVAPLPDLTAALSWLDEEHECLLAAQRVAADEHDHRTAWLFAWSLFTYHNRRGHRHDQLTACRAGLAATGHLNDPAAQLLANRLVGDAHCDLGQRDEAVEHLHRALDLAVRLGDHAEAAHTHRTLAWSWEQWGDHQRAHDHAVEALAAYRRAGHAVGEALALNAVGWCSALLGNYDRAREHCSAALERFRHNGSRTGEADTLDSLGFIDHHSGRYADAVQHYEQALSVLRDIANTYEEANTLNNLGHPLTALGHLDRARAVWSTAWELYRSQDREQEADEVRQRLDALDALGVEGIRSPAQ
ncbi:DNA-binding SARP family transcriptional activator [Lentzea atacamensis]|uniref:DNA-binding SARP family transcriptional activator n=1 Tax=Lentzea atacamensis TaxID=531938 RepID=A0ABX9EBM3_9PSEU|nr:BTAD domain-containing putative transcriptional regulator [Lentzea atacamensis]RAS65905.1 DNA-binding SARP family transcriptional activator [Lentzea atacamensis]